MRGSFVGTGILVMILAAMFGASSVSAHGSATYGKLRIHVSPKQAYVFVDGKALRDGSQVIRLEPGKHTVGVYNYGYAPSIQDVEIKSGTTNFLDVALPTSGGEVAGPFGEIQLKGPARAAVLLNGKTPDYFVGHVDEFNWDWIWHQRLLVHPGTYQVTVTRKGNTIWSGPVKVEAGQRVTVDLNHGGSMRTAEWNEGDKMGLLPRFHAGIASATVPIAPVTAQLDAQQRMISCGQSSTLDWKSADAVETSISDLGSVPASGDRAVSPKQTTTYQLLAKGPGGEATQSVTVNVQTQPVASLSLSQPQIEFHKIGDTVVRQDSTNLSWSASNASRVQIQPFGNEAMSGTQTVEAQPSQMKTGPINENRMYTLTATNACGGTVTRTANLQLRGSIEPAPAVTLASIFYPTAYPTWKHSKVGLVASERASLARAAEQFENHEKYDGEATLKVIAHADVRGSDKYNLGLSERRATLIRDFLVARGIPAGQIQISWVGKREQLDRQAVAKLQASDPQKPEKWMKKREKATWLAYNRRVDIVLEPKGQTSSEAYPNDVADARILWERRMPSLKQVSTASTVSRNLHQVSSASAMGN